MRCYTCSGFGHKSQDCWNTRRNSMMMISYSMTRRGNEVRKGEIFKKMEAQSSSFEMKGHLQKWVRRMNNQRRMEALREARVCHLLKHMQVTMVTVTYICWLTLNMSRTYVSCLCSKPCICGKALGKRQFT